VKIITEQLSTIITEEAVSKTEYVHARVKLIRSMRWHPTKGS